jgi:hypothetical protein
MKRFIRQTNIVLFAALFAGVIAMLFNFPFTPVFVALYALSFIPTPYGVLNGVTTMGQRVIYANAAEMLGKEGITVDIAILTQGYLRLEQAMVLAQTNILFPILVNQSTGGQFVTENRLQLQDAFVTSELGIFLFVPISATDTSTPLMSYPNQNYFLTTTAPAAETLYHSYLTLSINKQVIVPFWDTYRSYLVNQTQQIAPLTLTASSTQLSGRDDVFYPTEPNWVLIGSRANILTLVMPNAFSTVQPFARIVIFCRGVLAQNCTSVQ